MSHQVAIPRGPLGDSPVPAIRMVQSSRLIRRLANVVLFGLVLTCIAMIWVPWQQTSRGTGSVIAFVPQERQQTVTSPVKGIVAQVNPALREGARVKQGDEILMLEPQAATLRSQLENQLNDYDSKKKTAEAKAEAYAANIESWKEVLKFAVQAADEQVEAARAKLQSKRESVPGYEAKELQARLNHERQLRLFQQGATAEKEVEKLKKDLDVAIAELAAAKQDVKAAEEELKAKQSERQEKQRTAQTKIDDSRAYRETALGEIATVNKEIRDLQIKLDELKRQVITAPRDGTIFRMPLFERGQAVKESDPLFTIVPDTDQRAVELWIAGNDVPLVRPGDHVRLQFEGWPAVQVAGWPSIAVGTFGGEVFAIDATDDGTGRFRIQVRPSSEPGELDWPELRQGVRANGWVMLRKVRLGWELWRQLNGFPPSLSKEAGAKAEKDDADKKSVPKLPK